MTAISNIIIIKTRTEQTNRNGIRINQPLANDNQPENQQYQQEHRNSPPDQQQQTSVSIQTNQPSDLRVIARQIPTQFLPNTP